MRYILVLLGIFLLLLAIPANAQSPTWGVAARGNWGTLWTSTPLIKIMRDTPIPTSSAKTARIYAARNEYEPFQIVLTPKTRLSNIKIVPHTLLGPKKAKIAAWNISVKNVVYVNCTEPTSPDVKPGFYPDPLPDHMPFTAEVGTNSPVWVTVYVSRKTPAGEYKGTIDVIAEGMGKVSVPVSLRVWNFALPSVSRLRTAYGDDGTGSARKYEGATTIEQKRKITDLYNLNFFKHRVSPYTPYANYDIGVSTDGGAVKLDFTTFDIAVNKFFPLFNSYKLPHFGMGENVDFGKDTDAERMQIDYMRQIAEHMVDKGQLANGFDYITDEPQPDAYSGIIEAAKQIRMADQRIKILLTQKVEDQLIGSVDIWVPKVSDYDEQLAKSRQAKGEQVWWYLCCVPHHPYPNYFIDYPAIDLRMYHWMTWRYGLDGILYWETCYWQDNPWETPMSQTPDRSGKWGNGDGHLLYPPTKTISETFVAKGPVDSIRWETIRDGIEDWDYFRILQDKIDATPATKHTAPAYTAALEALKQVNDCVKSRTDYCTDPAQAESTRIKIALAIEGMK